MPTATTPSGSFPFSFVTLCYNFTRTQNRIARSYATFHFIRHTYSAMKDTSHPRYKSLCIRSFFLFALVLFTTKTIIHYPFSSVPKKAVCSRESFERDWDFIITRRRKPSQATSSCPRQSKRSTKPKSQKKRLQLWGFSSLKGWSSWYKRYRTTRPTT